MLPDDDIGTTSLFGAAMIESPDEAGRSIETNTDDILDLTSPGPYTNGFWATTDDIVFLSMALLGDEPISAPTTYVALNDELFELYCTGRLRIPIKYKGHFPRRGFRLINTDKEERAEGAAVLGRLTLAPSANPLETTRPNTQSD